MFLKKFLTLAILFAAISISLVAQTNKEYEANWKQVAAFEKKGLTRSALEEVIKIYNLAVKDNNDAQQIKSSIYQIKYRQMVQEDSRENNIFFIDTLIAKAKAPAKNILQSMQAELLWQYLQNNRYKFYERTKLAEENSKDISTWSLDKLHATISKLYNASLNNDALLKNTSLKNFDAILIKGENTRQLRPTLFDFLAHRALSYFMNDEKDLVKPAFHFIINDPAIFAPVNQFVKTVFPSKDSLSLHHKAILIFQDILKFHLNDNDKSALLDADLERLRFANQFAVTENKNKLYEDALQKIETVYAGNPGVAQAMYLRAQLYYSRGAQFVPLTQPNYQYEIKRAKDLCDETIKKFPGTEGAANCENLRNTILTPTLNLQTEKVNVPGQPFRTLVTYNNIKTLYFRIVKISRDEIQKINRRNYNELWKDMVALKPSKTWNEILPDPADYQSHSVEVKINELGMGTYYILASIDPNFSLEKNIVARQLTYVSNISYIHNNKNQYYVLNRDNGKPFANAAVQVWETKYNYRINSNEDTKAESYSTDKNGLFTLVDKKQYRNFILQVKANNDELFLDENNYSNYYNTYEPEIKPLTFLFTDRSIYRPGQTVFFKGIVIKKGNKATGTSIRPNFKTSIELKDANGQKVAELSMQTNEYGSYHGNFKLPAATLNGQFSLYDTTSNSYKYFSVEEYKRPKFFTEVNKPAGTYRVNDTIKVTGVAKAYAGNTIDGATVKYRVVRKVRYQPWWYYNYGGYGRNIFPPGRNSDEMEITNGEMITDSKGEFNISFKAIPDEAVDKKDQPTFSYEVTADITDINGETRSGNTTVAVAYQSLKLDITTPAKLPADSLKKIIVNSTNLNDIKETTLATISIFKLKEPAKIFRKRYWQQPDQFIMSKDEYYKYFPYDVYKDENDVKNYPVGEKIMETTDSTNKELNVNTNKLNAGWYKITAIAKDKYGEEVKTEKYVQLTDSKASSNINEPIIVEVKNAKAEPGEKINYSIQTGFSNIWLIHTLSKVDKDIATSYQDIRAGKAFTNTINVNEEDRGGIAVSYAFVQHNRVYEGSENFSIPWSNKDLNISYETFRDKILPGSAEKWKVKITGNKGEKVAAEMLAGMYDASLDQFREHSWSALNIWPTLTSQVNWMDNGFDAANSDEINRIDYKYVSAKAKSYDQLLGLNGYGMDETVVVGYGTKRKSITSRVASESAAPQAMEGQVAGLALVNDANGMSDSIAFDMKTGIAKKEEEPKQSTGGNDIQIRKNFNETAFFFPDLKTDEAGNISFEFTIPEALTEWKLMTFAHTRDLSNGYIEKSVVTQKPLMVQPNAPRFMREGDHMEFSAKIVNLSEKEITGTVQLELLDAATNTPIDGWFKNVFPNQYFTVAAGQSVPVKFPMEVPFNFNSAMTYRIVAKSSGKDSSGDQGFSDGEEMAIPVLTNRMLVTESMLLNMRNTKSKHFKFDKLLNSESSTTLTNHSLTVEYTSNPAWYAVQALPYLMEYPYECAEQVFNRYYANALASYISNSTPKIKAIFEKWKTLDTAALISNLQKNEELKSVLLQETPWVLAAQNESQQKQHIGLLFDMVKMSAEAEKAIAKLKEIQSSNGGFVWFKGGPDDRYITQYILTGIGHLKKLNALSSLNAGIQQELKSITDKAIPYLDKKIKEDYDNLIKFKVKLSDNNLSSTAIQYLYMRSFFTTYDIAPASLTAVNYYKSQAKKYWLKNNKYMQGMIALALHRSNDKITPVAIIKSLKENSIMNEELGMYWKEWTTGGYYWQQAPIESQSLMIEAFMDIDKNNSTIDDLKTWLLKQKQTQNWKTTKATAEACYALLLGGSNWLSEEKEVTINLGKTLVKSSEDKTEAGTGYFKKSFEAKNIEPQMGNITVSVLPSSVKTQSGSTSWGAVYWQYFEDLDKITSASTPLRLKKQLFIEKNTATGPQLQAIGDERNLKVGDKVKVRIELKVDRDMEYIHMKDMRAACMEPVNVLSGYKYQGGLGYYESTLDASTNFFFGSLPRGSYVFEYDLFVSLPGNFSNGITTIQCMYAPEFTSHSEGVRVEVEAP